MADIGIFLHISVTLLLAIRVLSQQRNQGVAVAWLVILFFMPVIGVIGYFLFGETNIGRRYRIRSLKAYGVLQDFAKTQQVDFTAISTTIDKELRQLSRIGERKTGLGVYDHHDLTLFTEPNAMFDTLLTDIAAARDMIILEYYIVYPKGRVLDIFAALIQASQRGVVCHLLADSVGSHLFFRTEWVKTLQDAGIKVHESFPVGLFKTLVKRIDIRNHRKIAVFDNVVGYTGSFNLVDPNFFKQNENVGKWVDVMMRVENHQPTSVVKAMSLVAATDISAETDDNLSWLEQTINHYTKQLYVFSSPYADENQGARSFFSRDARQRDKITQKQSAMGHHFPINSLSKEIHFSKPTLTDTTITALSNSSFPTVKDAAVQLIPFAPELTGHVIYETLICAIFSANQRVLITTPYFVPDDTLLIAMTTAAKRGVDVSLIVPQKVDSKLVRYASRAYYQSLLNAGVKIALYTEGLLHAKIVVIDDKYCLFGTVNMDMRSFYLNMEVSLAIYDTALVAQIVACQNEYLKGCVWINPEEWQHRQWYQRLWDNTVRLFSPLL